MARITGAAEEAGSLRLAHPRLASVAVVAAPAPAGGASALALGFLHLPAQAKFSVELALGAHPALMQFTGSCPHHYPSTGH